VEELRIASVECVGRRVRSKRVKTRRKAKAGKEQEGRKGNRRKFLKHVDPSPGIDVPLRPMSPGISNSNRTWLDYILFILALPARPGTLDVLQ